MKQPRPLHNGLNIKTWESWVNDLTSEEKLNQEVRWNLILCLRDIIPSILIVTIEETA